MACRNGDSMRNKTIIVQVLGLTKQDRKQTIVDHLTFTGYSGELLGIFGEEQKNKTSILKMMAGIDKKKEGTIILEGYDFDYDYKETRSVIQTMIQMPYFIKNMTGYEYLEQIVKEKNIPTGRLDQIEELLKKKVELAEKIKQYSKEKKLNLLLGAMLLESPKLILLEEPMKELSVLETRRMREFLQEIAHEWNLCIIVTGSSLWEVEALCDRMLLLWKGKGIGAVSKKDLIEKNKNLEDFYVEQRAYYAQKEELLQPNCMV